MNQAEQNMIRENDRLKLVRRLAAPLELVWKVYTEAEHLAHWWGPKGFEWVGCTLDLRPGGIFHYHMKSPDGTSMWGRFVYTAVEPMKQLSFIVSFSDENVSMCRAPWFQDWPLEVMNITRFEFKDGMTEVTLESWPINAPENEVTLFFNNMPSLNAGFKGTFDQLEEYLKEVL